MAENPLGSDLVVPAGGFKSWFGLTDSGWQTLTNQNGWTGTLRYRRVGKVVELRSASAAGTANTVMATLPVGFRPARLVQRMVPQSGTNGSDPNNCPCLIQPTGTILVTTLTNPTLSGVRFLADDVDNQIATRQTPPMVGNDLVAPDSGGFEDWFQPEDTGWIDASGLLVNSWVPVNTPMYRKRGSTVMLRGRVSGGSSATALIFTLPVGFRPDDSVRVIARNSSSTGTGTGAGSYGVSNLGNVQAQGPSGNLTIPNLDISFFADQ
jgi:hypothetical protein